MIENLLLNFSNTAKKVIYIAVFALSLSIGTYFYKISLLSKLDEIKSQNANLGFALEETNENIEFIKKHKDIFDARIKSGAFEPSSRVYATNVIETMRNTYELNSLSYEFSAPTTMEFEKNMQNILPNITTTNLSLRFGAFTDNDAFRMIFGISENFQGALLLKSFVITREKDITNDVLSMVAKGIKPDLVTGDATFSWRTLVEKPAFAERPQP